ncbi:unnamed protein product, partial [Polarella glacialis]
VWREVRSGLVSSVGAEAILFPLDTVKLRQQVFGGTVLQVLQRSLKEQGVRGLYQGLIGRLIQTITSNVGFFVWQTLFFQFSLKQLQLRAPLQEKLGTVASLVVNMLAQQFNRILTTPVDVVANVNQADPASKGFIHTFLRIARTGGVRDLWRGLPVSLLLSLNPALMFTLVGKLSDFLHSLRNESPDAPLKAADMFWISGVSKAVATILTYPLIRAKAVIQTSGAGQGLWAMLVDIVKKDGVAGLYQGVWIMSYKTILFNSLMMALKQKVSLLLDKADKARWQRRMIEGRCEGEWRQKVAPCSSCEMPWEAAARGAKIVYVDGSWSFLHAAQEHFLREAAQRGEHLVVGVHSDECHHAAVGSWPSECFAARLERLQHRSLGIATILQHAPWEVTEELVVQLGVSKVLSGSVTKAEDCRPRDVSSPRIAGLGVNGSSREAPSAPAASADPYAECKRLGIFEEVPSLNASTEHDEWLTKVVRVAFSNVDASIDWRILVQDGALARWGQNPGYAEAPLSPKSATPSSRARI